MKALENIVVNEESTRKEHRLRPHNAYHQLTLELHNLSHIFLSRLQLLRIRISPNCCQPFQPF